MNCIHAYIYICVSLCIYLYVVTSPSYRHEKITVHNACLHACMHARMRVHSSAASIQATSLAAAIDSGGWWWRPASGQASLIVIHNSIVYIHLCIYIMVPHISPYSYKYVHICIDYISFYIILYYII